MIPPDNPYSIIPGDYSLEQNYPNPFNPETEIIYYLPESSRVKVEVLNSLGEVVSLLDYGYKNEGEHKIKFDGSELSSGMYFCRVYSNEKYKNTIKMILIK